MTHREHARKLVAVAMLILVSLTAPLGATQERPMPNRIAASDADWSIWVDSSELEPEVLMARHAAGATGIRHADWLRRELRRARRAEAAGEPPVSGDSCVEYFISAHHPRLPGTFEELVSQATAVVNGRVSGTADGLLDGEPGVLLRIDVAAWLKGAHASPTVYVFYPAPRIELAGLAVCRPRTGWPGTPAVGQPILLLPGQPVMADTSDGPLLALGGYGLIFEEGDAIRFNSALAGILPELPTSSSLSELVDLAAQLVRR